MKRLVAYAFFAWLLAGCAGSGAFRWADARQIKEGMSEAEIIRLIGPPYMVTSTADGQRWLWVHANGFTGGAQSLSIPMKNGKVFAAPPIPDAFRD